MINKKTEDTVYEIVSQVTTRDGSMSVEINVAGKQREVIEFKKDHHESSTCNLRSRRIQQFNQATARFSAEPWRGGV